VKVVGKIRWFDHEKRHGYADCPEQKIWDVLIHQDQVINYEQNKDLLVRGARVEFELQFRARGVHVRVFPVETEAEKPAE
jgi:cold shock CspA family protein